MPPRGSSSLDRPASGPGPKAAGRGKVAEPEPATPPVGSSPRPAETSRIIPKVAPPPPPPPPAPSRSFLFSCAAPSPLVGKRVSRPDGSQGTVGSTRGQNCTVVLDDGRTVFIARDDVTELADQAPPPGAARHYVMYKDRASRSPAWTTSNPLVQTRVALTGMKNNELDGGAGTVVSVVLARSMRPCPARPNVIYAAPCIDPHCSRSPPPPSPPPPRCL